QRPVAATDQVAPALRVLLDGYPSTPAFVINPVLDILAANALAEALYSPFEAMDNLARMVFLDPAGRPFHPRWDRTAETVVGHLRQASGVDPGSPRLRALVGELSTRSTDFARLWNTHTVRGKTRENKHFHHPDVGGMTLTHHAFDVRDAPGQQLIIYHAERGSPSAEALSLLGSVHATATGPTGAPTSGGPGPPAGRRSVTPSTGPHSPPGTTAPTGFTSATATSPSTPGAASPPTPTHCAPLKPTSETACAPPRPTGTRCADSSTPPAP
ncbi:hypothetical protein ACFXPZ_41560, partial [Streptomyces sp. NPDC059101]